MARKNRYYKFDEYNPESHEESIKDLIDQYEQINNKLVLEEKYD